MWNQSDVTKIIIFILRTSLPLCLHNKAAGVTRKRLVSPTWPARHCISRYPTTQRWKSHVPVIYYACWSYNHKQMLIITFDWSLSKGRKQSLFLTRVDVTNWKCLEQVYFKLRFRYLLNTYCFIFYLGYFGGCSSDRPWTASRSHCTSE